VRSPVAWYWIQFGRCRVLDVDSTHGRGRAPCASCTAYTSLKRVTASYPLASFFLAIANALFPDTTFEKTALPRLCLPQNSPPCGGDTIPACGTCLMSCVVRCRLLVVHHCYRLWCAGAASE